VEEIFFGKSQKVGSWTKILGKEAKGAKKRLNPLNLICISILFSFSFSEFL
jgi:hypothetical protein